MASPDGPQRRGTLVVGPAWVGDMVMAQALFKVLATRYPDEPVDVVAPQWSVPLVERMNEVRAAHVLAVGHGQLGVGVRRALGHALRGKRYARAITIPRSFKAALVPYFARIPMRTGYTGEWRFGLLNDRRLLDKTRLPTTVARYVALGLPKDSDIASLPRPSLRVDGDHQQTLLQELGLDSGQPVVALLPGAEYGPAKQWPLGHFAALASQLTGDGCAVWVLGSQKEASLGAAIVKDTPAINLCGRTSLRDVVDLLHSARVAVSNDSGLMHIAAATGCAVVGIYGSSSAAFTPPLTERASIVQALQPCSPCFARTCRFGHYRCLVDIDVARVAAQVYRWLQ